MANVITSVATQEKPEFQLFLKPLLDDPQINQLPFDLIVGKYQGQELYFNTQLDKITTKKVACGWTFAGATSFTKKTITPIELQASVEACYTELKETIFARDMADGWRRGELTPELLSYLAEQQKYAFNRDMLSFLYLGDTVASVPYYTVMDGVYKKLKAGANASDGTVDAGAVTATDLNATNFFDTMKGIYDAQTRFLKNVEKSRKVWIWTEAVYDAYLNYLYKSTQTNAGIIQRETIVNGLEANVFLNIPIVVVKIVDERLEQDFLSGSPAEPLNPFRIILTDPSNHKIMLDGTGFLEQEAWYERKDDTYYMVGSSLLAYEYGYGELNVIAGF
jgi:hypothetical protein